MSGEKYGQGRIQRSAQKRQIQLTCRKEGKKIAGETATGQIFLGGDGTGADLKKQSTPEGRGKNCKSIRGKKGPVLEWKKANAGDD